MHKFVALMVAPLMALGLSGCMTAIPPVEVVRFHEGAPAPRGTIAIEDMSGATEHSIEFRTYAAAVGQELQRIGFSQAESGQPSDYVARVGYSRFSRTPALAGRSPVSVGVGGSTGSYGSGIGVGVGINLSGPPKPVVTTTLEVQIRQKPEGKAVWEGRAHSEAKEGTPAAQPGLAAPKLAAALFGGYPGQSGQTITVK